MTHTNFIERENQACDSGKIYVSQLGWTDVFKKLPALNTVVQCADKDVLIQLNPQTRHSLKGICQGTDAVLNRKIAKITRWNSGLTKGYSITPNVRCALTTW